MAASQPPNPLTTLLSTPRPPAFTYLHHPYHSHATLPPLPTLPHAVVTIDAAIAPTPRAFYTAITRSARTHVHGEEEDARDGKDVVRFDAMVREVDGVMRRLVSGKGKRKQRSNGAAVAMHLDVDGSASSSSHLTAISQSPADITLILLIHRAETLPKLLGPGWGVLTRLSELTVSSTSVVLTSQTPWDLIRPATSDAVEPIHVYLARPTKFEVLQQLLRPTSNGPSSSSDLPVDHPLYPHFLLLLYSSFAHLIPHSVVAELDRLAGVLWDVWSDGVDLAAFAGGQSGTVEGGGLESNGVDPVEMSGDTSARVNGDVMNADVDMTVVDAAACASRPPTAITPTLLTHLTRQSTYAFSAASSLLLTRQVTGEWFKEHYIPSRVRQRQLDKDTMGEDVRAFMGLIPTSTNGVGDGGDVAAAAATSNATNNPFLTTSVVTRPSLPKPKPPRIPYYAKYIVLAAYFASFNPRTTDLRMFGRGPLAEPWKGRKKGGGMRKVGVSRNVVGKVGKVPQRLLGPKSFPLERMFAIFQSLLAEHGYADHHQDDDVPGVRRRTAIHFGLTDEEREEAQRREIERIAGWEEEVEELSRSIGVWGMIPELESLRLIQITSPRDRLDRILLRSETPKEFVHAYASQLGIKDVARYLAEE